MKSCFFRNERTISSNAAGSSAFSDSYFLLLTGPMNSGCQLIRWRARRIHERSETGARTFLSANAVRAAKSDFVFAGWKTLAPVRKKHPYPNLPPSRGKELGKTQRDPRKNSYPACSPDEAERDPGIPGFRFTPSRLQPLLICRAATFLQRSAGFLTRENTRTRMSALP